MGAATFTDSTVGDISFCALVECRGSGLFSFALPGQPYRRLRLAATGHLEWDPGPTARSRACGVRESSWLVECLDGSTATTQIVCISTASRKGSDRLYLAPTSTSVERVGSCRTAVLELASSSPLRTRSEESRWLVTIIPEGAASNATFPTNEPISDSRQDFKSGLSIDDLRHFSQDGFVIVKGAVPDPIWMTAKSFINGRLGSLAAAGTSSCNSAADINSGVTGTEVEANGLSPLSAGHPAEGTGEAGNDDSKEEDPAGQAHVRHALHNAWGSSSRQLTSLCACATVTRLLEQLLGVGCVGDFGAQVALRFPGIRDDLVAGGAAVRAHVSGSDWHTDGLRQGKKHPFSLLVGVALSDMVGPDQGNLCVWPGSHIFSQTHSRWPDAKFRRPGGWDRGDGPLPDLGQPVQLRLRAGDLVLAHSELAHCGGPLLGPDIRYMTYFRVKHRDWRSMHEASQFREDMWCDFQGLRTALNGELPAATAAGEGGASTVCTTGAHDKSNT